MKKSFGTLFAVQFSVIDKHFQPMATFILYNYEFGKILGHESADLFGNRSVLMDAETAFPQIFFAESAGIENLFDTVFALCCKDTSIIIRASS